MVSCSVDEAGLVLAFSYSGHVTPLQLENCLEKVRDEMHLEPGFVVLSDLTHLESMDEECAVPLGAIMDLLSSRELSATVRVIPDPTKDIGFNLISLFHFRNPVRTHTHATLAEAINSVVSEYPSLRAVA